MTAESLQKALTTEFEKFKSIQKDLQKYIGLRQQLDSQLNENTLVIEELKLLASDGRVFKMVGPVLIKQDLEEAKQNVQKRIDYINGEIKRHETVIKEKETAQDALRDKISQLQAQMQAAAPKPPVNS